jgi:cellulose synthase/poly-beta-1,6-N-acetylglucosamine synthase-like glycosyltransferase
MDLLEIIFWLSAACVFAAYFGYPAVLAVAAKLWSRPVRRESGFRAPVSFVVCAHNEGDRIAGRVSELIALLEATGVQGEVVVACDGSTDGTAEKARQAGSAVRVLEMTDRVGKATALSAGCRLAQHDILVLADCRQRWDPAALARLLENFADPRVGAVSGDLVLETEPGVMAGVGLYWRYEKWLRRKESEVHSTVGLTGAICAVRRSLFPGVPAGTILDDVYWPLRVALEGYRVVHDSRAVAYDRLPQHPRDEFRRKVRTLAGNFQLVTRLPRIVMPIRNPLWLQFLAHKLLRLAVPWAMLAMLVSSALLPGAIYQAALIAQLAFYGLALIGSVGFVGRRLRPAATAASVMVLNAAAWLAFWVWVTGRAGRSWSKVSYQHPRRVEVVPKPRPAGIIPVASVPES